MSDTQGDSSISSQTRELKHKRVSAAKQLRFTPTGTLRQRHSAPSRSGNISFLSAASLLVQLEGFLQNLRERRLSSSAAEVSARRSDPSEWSFPKEIRSNTKQMR